MSYDDWLTTPPPMESAEEPEDECSKCHKTMDFDGKELTDLCHDCAHIEVDSLRVDRAELTEALGKLIMLGAPQREHFIYWSEWKASLQMWISAETVYRRLGASK